MLTLLSLCHDWARMSRRMIWVCLAGVVLGLGLAVFLWPPLFHPLRVRMFGRASVAQRVEQHGAEARARLQPYFEAAAVVYPPSRFALVAIKAEQRLELYAAAADGPFKYLRSYNVLAASGKLGPKLLDGDRQVPEGLYRIEALNPNSRYHLALRLDYPNLQDREQAARDGRSELGGDIMIHGRNASIGCLAMGDAAAEELFVLAADAGWERAAVVIAPVDLRRDQPPAEVVAALPWTATLYAEIKRALSQYPQSAPPPEDDQAPEHKFCQPSEQTCGDPIARGEAEARFDLAHGRRFYYWIGEPPPYDHAQKFEKQHQVKLQLAGCVIDTWDVRKAQAYNDIVAKPLGITGR